MFLVLFLASASSVNDTQPVVKHSRRSSLAPIKLLLIVRRADFFLQPLAVFFFLFSSCLPASENQNTMYKSARLVIGLFSHHRPMNTTTTYDYRMLLMTRNIRHYLVVSTFLNRFESSLDYCHLIFRIVWWCLSCVFLLLILQSSEFNFFLFSNLPNQIFKLNLWVDK